jgi:hypothetical protein
MANAAAKKAAAGKCFVIGTYYLNTRLQVTTILKHRPSSYPYLCTIYLYSKKERYIILLASTGMPQHNPLGPHL